MCLGHEEAPKTEEFLMCLSVECAVVGPLKENLTGLLGGFDKKTGRVSLSKCGLSVDQEHCSDLLTTTLMLPYLICLSPLWLQHTAFNQKAQGIWQGLFYSCIESDSPSVTHLP